MLMDENDTEPGAEERAAERANLLAYQLAAVIQGHHVADAMNAIGILILESMQFIDTTGPAMGARLGVANHFRHVASHVDLTCPHIAAEAKGLSAANDDDAVDDTPKPPTATLH